MAVLLGFSSPEALGQALVITNGVKVFSTLSNTVVTLSDRCELRVTAPTGTLSGCVISLNSSDAFLVLANVQPALAAGYLSQVRIHGAAAVANGNCRLAQYGGGGTMILPHVPSFQPLEVFDGPQFTGGSATLKQYVYYRGAALGALNSAISSFKLKRGYTATFAQNEDGSGLSRNYVAQDGDLEVSLLPADFDDSVRFIYVTAWRWTSKKGVAGNIEGPLNVQWKYNWSISQDSTPWLEYVPIRQARFWPDLASQNWQTHGANHLLGYNEPDRPDQANLTVTDAISSWPDLLATGLRAGAPAVSDGGRNSWLYPFITQADAAGLRVDFVPVHYYWCFNPADPAGAANQMYGFLKATYDAVKRPLWITEWNNGANWTGCGAPTFAQQQAAVSAMVNMLESTPFVERYAFYNWVEDVRRLVWDDASLTAAGVTYRDKVSGLAYQQAFPDNASRSFTHLRFESDALDSSGYGNNGVTSGSPAYAAGHQGQAVVFDGANTVVTLPPNLARATGFTFAAWIYWGGGANWQRIFDFGNSTTEYLYLTPGSGGGTLRFAIKNNGAEQGVETGALPANQWRHVAVTLSGGTARLYVNGAVVVSKAGFTISPANFSPRVNFLGRSQFVTDPLFHGMMDEVVIADTAFSATQIASLLTDTPPEFANRFNLLADAAQGQPYIGSIAGSATDTNGDALVYSKVSGPAWLKISADGSLSGSPTGSDGGPNYFTVRVSDPAGAGASAVFAMAVSSPLTERPALLARYAFNGNANDGSGNAFHGTATGAATYGAGKYASAVDLDGASGSVTLPAKLLTGVTNFTIATWVRWDGGGPWQRIFDFGNGTTQYLFISPSSSSGRLRFAMKNGGAEQAVETGALPIGQWNHVAITLGGTTARLYVNGVLAASNTAMTITPSSFNPRMNFLGRSQYVTDPLFHGALDEMCVFNYPLSAAEIGRLISNRLPPTTAAQLLASVDRETLHLSWSLDFVGSRLESNHIDLGDLGAWTMVAGSSSTNQISVPIDSSSTNAFFRLVYP